MKPSQAKTFWVSTSFALLGVGMMYLILNPSDYSPMEDWEALDYPFSKSFEFTLISNGERRDIDSLQELATAMGKTKLGILSVRDKKNLREYEFHDLQK